MSAHDIEHKPTNTTMAMGFKQNINATATWRRTVRRERHARAEWTQSYLPAAAAAEDDYVRKYKEQQAAARVGPPRDGARALLYEGVSKDGNGRVAYLKARRAMTPQQRCGDQVQPPSAAQLVGWRLNEPIPRGSDLPNYAKKPVVECGLCRSTAGRSLFSQRQSDI